MDRRRFLKALGLGAAVGMAPVPLPPAAEAPVGMVKARAYVSCSQELLEDTLSFQDMLMAALERAHWLQQQFEGLDRKADSTAWRKRELQLGLGLGRTTPGARLPG